MRGLDGCERTFLQSPGPPLTRSREAADPTRLSICVDVRGLDQSASVEAQDRAKVGAVSLQGRFHSILSQLPKWSKFETAGNCATRNLTRRSNTRVSPSIQPCHPPCATTTTPRWRKTSYRNRVKSDERGSKREKVPPYRCSRHGGVSGARGRSYHRGSVVGTGRDRDI